MARPSQAGATLEALQPLPNAIGWFTLAMG